MYQKTTKKVQKKTTITYKKPIKTTGKDYHKEFFWQKII